MTQAEITQLLRSRYQAPKYLLVTEVSNGTGMGASRRVDAVAISMWPSADDGLARLAIEIKSSRADLLRELKDAEKEEDGPYRHCHGFILAAPSGVVKDLSELPMHWGYLECRPKIARMVRKPILRTLPSDDAAIAALARAIHNQSPSAALIEAERADAAVTRLRCLTADMRRTERDMKRRMQQYAQAEEIFAQLYCQAGCHPRYYGALCEQSEEALRQILAPSAIATTDHLHTAQCLAVRLEAVASDLSRVAQRLRGTTAVDNEGGL